MARTPAKQAISTMPPKNVASAAARGLRLREQHGRGGTAIGVARARDLSAQKSLSTQTIRRMHAYFARHSVDKSGKGWADRSAPSAGYIAWLLWGGDAGQRWAARLYQRLEDAANAGTATGKSVGAGSTAAADARGTKARTAGKAAVKRTAKKTAANKVAKKASGASSVKKPTAGKAAARNARAGSAATRKSSTGARKAGGTTAARKPAAKKAAASKTAARKATANKRPAKKTTTRKTATRRPAASKSASTRSTANNSAGKASVPWNTPNPKRTSRKRSLSPAQTTQAKQRAKAAGRPYPNLVDNMAVARKGNAAKKTSGSRAAKNTGSH
ncbi:DNA-binding protein [Xanthomonas floridensis]|uniref:DNA-binding protein n=1 Tax=Xanthomonas floridensis TaxID=1843580 RepID=A0ABU5Q1T9_9XANT|nr:DNA-binding protein [Xanthomonas floridensis]MEA5125840.1 DNA-binding protein [Xanthomonas floridensis]MEA5133417.1 DNA-binding protein [Xanthomonas floridensis]